MTVFVLEIFVLYMVLHSIYYLIHRRSVQSFYVIFTEETTLLTEEQPCNILFASANISSSLLQRLKEAKSRARKSKSKLANSMFETPNGPRPSGVQRNIKEFYRSTKGPSIESGKQPVGESSTAKASSRKSSDTDLSQNQPTSIRRRLQFD